MTAPLVLSGVGKRLGDRQVLDGLTLQLLPGEVTALLGANGSGKTTTLNLILGFLRPDAGRITVDGIDVAADVAGARARLAYLPEQVALYPHLSGTDNLRYFTTLAGLKLSAEQRAAFLSDTGLPFEAHRRPANGYSKGMRQRVGIAIALARAAPLLLLDEPNSGLDPLATSELSALVRRVAARGTAVLVVSHDLAGIRDMADRAILLENGRVARTFAPDAIDAAAITAIYGGGHA